MKQKKKPYNDKRVFHWKQKTLLIGKKKQSLPFQTEYLNILEKETLRKQ